MPTVTPFACNTCCDTGSVLEQNTTSGAWEPTSETCPACKGNPRPIGTCPECSQPVRSAATVEQKSYGRVAFVAEVALARLERQTDEPEPVELEAVHVGLTAEQEIRRDALREAVAFAGEAFDWDDVRDGVTEILDTAGRFAAWIADGDPAADDLRPVPRGRDEAEHRVAQALKDAWPGEPFGDDRVFTEQVAAVAVRTLGALLREGAPAHGTASEGSVAAVDATEPAVGTSTKGGAE